MAWEPVYATVAELRSYRGIPDSSDDVELADALESASRSVDFFTGRQFGQTDAVESRDFYVVWDGWRGLWHADIDDVMTTVGLVVTVDGTALTSSDYELLPLNSDKRGRPWEQIILDDATTSDLDGTRRVTIDATWGWSSVPEPIKQGTKLQANLVFKSKEAHFGVAGSPELGSELRIRSDLHPTVAPTIRPYRRLEKARMFA